MLYSTQVQEERHISPFVSSPTLGVKDVFLSVVIPAFNEAVRLPSTLKHVLQYLDSQAYTVEVIVINDGSVDDTAQVVENFQAQCPYLRLLNLPHNQGKGASLRAGFKAAKGRYALMYDADRAVPIDTIEDWLNAETPDALEHIIIGSRSVEEDGVVREFNPFRHFVSLVFQTLTQWLIPDIEDTQCGFKLFPAQAYRLFADLQFEKGFAADLEYLMMAETHGFYVEERGVSWTNMAGSKVNVWVDSWKMLFAMFRIKYRTFKGCYN
ncbi:MAG: dolichyl-phosphate beta-glucosyltransferase [Vampirovibrionales bacterium]